MTFSQLAREVLIRFLSSSFSNLPNHVLIFCFGKSPGFRYPNFLAATKCKFPETVITRYTQITLMYLLQYIFPFKFRKLKKLPKLKRNSRSRSRPEKIWKRSCETSRRTLIVIVTMQNRSKLPWKRKLKIRFCIFFIYLATFGRVFVKMSLAQGRAIIFVHGPH